jgi:hypothetical protein
VSGIGQALPVVGRSANSYLARVQTPPVRDDTAVEQESDHTVAERKTDDSSHQEMAQTLLAHIPPQSHTLARSHRLPHRQYRRKLQKAQELLPRLDAQFLFQNRSFFSAKIGCLVASGCLWRLGKPFLVRRQCEIARRQLDSLSF